MKQKILFVVEVDVADTEGDFCQEDCPGVILNTGSRTCRFFSEWLGTGNERLRRCSKCIVAAGNHNVLKMCLAGK